MHFDARAYGPVVDNGRFQRNSAKTADLKICSLIFSGEEWCGVRAEQGFRKSQNGGGSVENHCSVCIDGTPEDLCDCRLSSLICARFCGAKTVIARAGFNAVVRKRSELKYILLTESQSDGGMMPFCTAF